MSLAHYYLPVSETISTAWRKIYGVKGSIWVAVIILALITFILTAIDYYLRDHHPTAEAIYYWPMQILTYLLQMGVLYLGIQRAYDLPVSYKMMFRSFEWPVAWRLIIVFILQWLILLPFAIMLVTFVILVFLPTLALAIFGTAGDLITLTTTAMLVFSIFALLGLFFIIFLAIRMMLAPAFVMDRISGPVKAIKYSFQATHGNFWRILSVLFLQFLILVISIIPLGIGLIWTIPFSNVLYGVLYRSLSVNVTNP